MEEENTKKCCICKEIKDIIQFPLRADFKHKKRRTECQKCINYRTKLLWRKTRKEIFDYYGWKCNCCGESTPEFMTLDHIYNDGYLDKNPNGTKKSGKELYLLVKKQGFPKKYQTLCHNCNFAKKLENGCPHQRYGK